MTSNTRTRSDLKREAIIQAATQAFQEYGVNGTSMDKLAELANVSKRTVYNHFSTKDELVMYLVTQQWQSAILNVTTRYDSAIALDEQLRDLILQDIEFMASETHLELARVAIGHFFYEPEKLKDEVAQLKAQETAMHRWLKDAKADGKMRFDELDRVVEEQIPPPNPEDATKFWSDIWSTETNHDSQAVWIEEVEHELARVQKQQNIRITREDINNATRKFANWKAPGPDGVQGFWFKKLPAMHGKIATHLQQCLDTGNVPEWMTKGKTVLVIKDPLKGNEVGNYRPIACLPIMWKLMTGIFSEKIYQHLDQNELLVEEQKGCRKNSRGTKDQLLIDKAILKNCKRRHTNLSMSWIDYRKAYDLVPHSWINKCIDMFAIADNIKDLIRNSMRSWKTRLTSDNQILGEVEINRGIFQGDSLSPLLFVLIMTPLSFILRNTSLGYKMSKTSEPISHLLFMDDLKLYATNKSQLDSLVNVVKIFSNDIKMEFGLSKCAVLELKRGKVVKS
ncbi:MAG: reverse transcriptase domain-containing protein [Pseudomonadota bacterium]